HRGQRGARERQAAEEPQVDDRIGAPRLPCDEHRERGRGRREAQQDPRRRPPEAGALDDRVADRSQQDHDQYLSERVGPSVSTCHSGTKRAVMMSAATPTGMFIQKTPRQPTEPTSAPPTTGPSATDSPNTLPHIPIARARSPGSVKVLVTIAIATGLSID